MKKIREIVFGEKSNKQLLAKNTFWLGMVEVVSKLIMFLVTISIVRYLGPVQFGAYTFVMSLVALLMIFSDFGVGTILTRDVAKDKSKATPILANALGMRVATSGLIMVLMSICLPFLGSNKIYIFLIVVTTIYSIVQQFQGLMQAALQAFEKMEYIFVVRVTYYLGVLLATMVTIKFDMGINWLMINYLTLGILNIVVCVWLLNKLGVDIKFEWNKKLWTELLKESAPIFGFIACTQIYGNLDTILISKYFGNAQVGIYQSAYKILYAFQSVNIINSATFPRISVLIHEGKHDTVNRLIKAIIGGSIVVLVPLVLFIGWQSNLIIGLIYGNKYLAAAPIMTALVWVGVINYFRTFATNLLVAKGKQKYVFLAVLVGLVVNVTLNVTIMPRVGFAFAATSLVISELTILALSLGLARIRP